ncbi:MAG TPA: glycine zipper 2TM domain-containing protein [Gemmatirosa sp.]
MTTAPVAQPTAVTPDHHSKLGGAVAGGVVGHMIGGRTGMLAGAAAGAMIQHHRNKVAERQAAAASNP